MQFHHVLHRTVIALNLSPGHQVSGCAVHTLDVLALQIILQAMGQGTGSVVGEQPCTQGYFHPVHAGLSQSDLQGLLHIPGVHRGGELPS